MININQTRKKSDMININQTRKNIDINTSPATTEQTTKPPPQSTRTEFSAGSHEPRRVPAIAVVDLN
jgi:hypothetical protein